MLFKYAISPVVHQRIDSFYTNVAKKYCHTYSYELMIQNMANAYNAIYGIENGLMRRKPLLPQWKNYYMATSKDGRWNFAYRIKGNTIYVEDACHSQNIHELTILSEAEVQYGKQLL